LSESAARVSFAAATAFLVLLTALHFIKPEVDPSWQMVSEYELGPFGWIMVIAFLCLALSTVSLFVAIRSHISTTGGRIGLGFLLVVAAALTLGAIFRTDPMTVTRDAMTSHGRLHGWGFLLGVPSILIAAPLITWSLVRTPAWSSARRSLGWTAGFMWVGIVVLVLTIAVVLPKHDGTFGPGVPVGWPNRTFIVAQAAWVLAVSWHVLRLRRQRG
jgi:hypothetical protein